MDKVCPKCRRSYSSSDMFCPEDGAALALNDENAAPDVANDTSTSEAEANDPLIGRVLDGTLSAHEAAGRRRNGASVSRAAPCANRTVAVKVLHRSRVDDPKELDRFKSTAVHAGTIVDDHVAQVYDFGETERWSRLSRDGVRAWRHDHPHGEEGGLVRAGARRRAHASDREGPRCGARAGHHPSRSQA